MNQQNEREKGMNNGVIDIALAASTGASHPTPTSQFTHFNFSVTEREKEDRLIFV